jgi:hypothetical protein
MLVVARGSASCGSYEQFIAVSRAIGNRYVILVKIRCCVIVTCLSGGKVAQGTDGSPLFSRKLRRQRHAKRLKLGGARDETSEVRQRSCNSTATHDSLKRT